MCRCSILSLAYRCAVSGFEEVMCRCRGRGVLSVVSAVDSGQSWVNSLKSALIGGALLVV